MNLRRLAAFLWFFLCISVSLAQGETASPIADAVKRADEAIAAILAIPDDQRTFANTVAAVDDALVRFDKQTSMIQFMGYVSTSKEERSRGEAAQEHYNNWMIELRNNEPLYRALLAVERSERELTGERKRLLEHMLRDYRRAGMDLSPEDRERFKQHQMEISRLSIEFDRGIREDQTVVLAKREELRGVSEDVLQRLPQAQGLYIIGMDYPTYNAVMSYCEDEATRQKVWTAYRRRGGAPNVDRLERMIRHRAMAAELLGYAHAADYEIEVRMAQDAPAVKAFYEKLRPMVRQKALRDFEEFQQAKREHTGDPNATFQFWDFAFYEKKLQQTRYAVDGRLVQQYFPLERVTEGLFTITQALYGLEYREITEAVRSGSRESRWPLWHEDVRLYEVWDKVKGQLLGEFYIDLHPREGKYTHAAQWGLVPRKRWADGSIERPVAALVCNFTKPTAEKPSLLTHQEVETYFHEFGHCLHTILTEADFGRFAGTNVEGDFVEAPSQMFENWVWNADVLRTFARHYQTGEAIPDELVQGMIRARQLGSGIVAERQFMYGLADLAFHTAPGGEVDTTKTQYELIDEVELFDHVPHTYYHAGFGHLANPYYVAGYYGYQWSLVYAQDMFQRFKELGMMSPEAGMHYRRTILARGGTVDAMDMIREYLGREPSMEPYLRHLGLQGAPRVGGEK